MPTADIGLVLDCTDPEALAVFWAKALGYTLVGSLGSYVLLVPPGGDGAHLLLQRVGEPKSVKNRMHLDIHSADITADADRLTRLGARRVEDTVREEHGSRWILMADPEGNEFCVCDAAGGC